MHVYEVRPRKDQRGVDVISDVIRVYDEAGNVIGLRYCQST